MDYSDLRHLMAAILLAPKLKDKSTTLTLDPNQEFSDKDLDALSEKTLPDIHGVYQVVDSMLEMEDEYEGDEDGEDE